jgi:hypothetical protein
MKKFQKHVVFICVSILLGCAHPGQSTQTPTSLDSNSSPTEPAESKAASATVNVQEILSGTLSVEPKIINAIPAGQGLILGTFSIKGYLPNKPSLHLAKEDESWTDAVRIFGTSYDIRARHANVILFSVPPGKYKVVGTSVPRFGGIVPIAPYHPIYTKNRYQTDFSFSVQEGKVTYIGDLFFLFNGGFGGLNPEVKNVTQSDKFTEDLPVFRLRVPNIDKYEVKTGENLAQPQ